MKRLLFVLLAMLISCLPLYNIYADNSFNEIIGYVTEVEGDSVYIFGESTFTAEPFHVLVDIGDAAVYDLVTGYSVPKDTIKTGMGIRTVYHNDSGEAAVVWINWDDEYAAVFSVTVSDNIIYIYT
jgi:hypothetical protein